MVRTVLSDPLIPDSINDHVRYPKNYGDCFTPYGG